MKYQAETASLVEHTIDAQDRPMLYVTTHYVRLPNGTFLACSKAGKGQTSKHVLNAYKRVLCNHAETTIFWLPKGISKAQLGMLENKVLQSLSAQFRRELHASGVESEKFNTDHNDAVKVAKAIIAAF